MMLFGSANCRLGDVTTVRLQRAGTHRGARPINERPSACRSLAAVADRKIPPQFPVRRSRRLHIILLLTASRYGPLPQACDDRRAAFASCATMTATASLLEGCNARFHRDKDTNAQHANLNRKRYGSIDK